MQNTNSNLAVYRSTSVKTVIIFLLGLFLSWSPTTLLNAQELKLPVFVQQDSKAPNPNAERDMQTVSDYLRSLMLGDPEKAKSLLTDSCKISGPGEGMDVSADKVIAEWKENYKTNKNPSLQYYHSNTWRNTTGNIQGNWVSVWSSYACTINGTEVAVPFHFAASMTDDGKIRWGLQYWDRLALMEKLGYKLTPPGDPKSGKKSK